MSINFDILLLPFELGATMTNTIPMKSYVFSYIYKNKDVECSIEYWAKAYCVTMHKPYKAKVASSSLPYAIPKKFVIDDKNSPQNGSNIGENGIELVSLAKHACEKWIDNSQRYISIELVAMEIYTGAKHELDIQENEENISKLSKKRQQLKELFKENQSDQKEYQTNLKWIKNLISEEEQIIRKKVDHYVRRSMELRVYYGEENHPEIWSYNGCESRESFTATYVFNKIIKRIKHG